MISLKKIIAVGPVLLAAVGLAGYAGAADNRPFDRVLPPHLAVPVAATRPAALPYWVLGAVQPADGGVLLAALPVENEVPRTAVPVAPGKRFGAFDSVAISAGALPMAKKFKGVTRVEFSALFSDGCDLSGLAGCDTRLVEKLRDAHRRAVGQSETQMLDIVNAAVNSELPYAADRAIWGQGDYWATPSEIALKGAGDCEDFAIAKMWLLRSLGFPADRLQVVVLQNTQKRIYHAVLAVHVGGERLILDNLSASVRADTSYSSYMPIMSFVGGKSYIHGFERKRTDRAEMPKDLASVMPGEGV